MKRAFSALILFILFISMLTGCRDTHRHYGKYPEFFSIGIYSLLGISGSEMDSIEILEQDIKGRTMFAFISNWSNIDGTLGLYSIMICQKIDTEYTYYYSDYNFIVAHTKEEISENAVTELKAKNDWGQNIEESKMTKVRINRSKMQNNSGGSRKEKIFKDKGEVDFNNEIAIFLSLGTDKNDRWLYYVAVFDKDNNYKRSYMLILNKDYSYESSYLQLIDDVWNYQDQLKEFKEFNKWSLYV